MFEAIAESLRALPGEPQQIEAVRRRIADELAGSAPSPTQHVVPEDWLALAKIESVAEDPDRLIRDGPLLGSILAEWEQHGDGSRQQFALVLRRDDIVKVLRGLERRMLSRTSFVSFVSASEFPSALKVKLLGMAGDDLERLRAALEAGDLLAIRGLI